jgi:zinc protease
VRGARLLAACAVAGLLSWPASGQVSIWPTERPPRPLPARSVKFPPYSIRTLPNGLQVVAVSHHEQPAVSLRLIVRAGGAQDPASKPGVATLAASLLDQGTTTKSAEEIASTIDSIGGALGTGAGSDLTFVNAVVMKDSLALALDLVADVARHPAFDPEEVERQRQQILSGLKVSYDDPDYLAGTVFDRIVYGPHPYGRPDAGTPASIASVTRDDLLAFHRTWFGANNAILAIVGDVSADEAFAGAQRAFGDWPRVDSSAASSLDPPAPARRVVVIDRPGAVQTEIRVGNIALPRKHPDFFALDLAMKILGGEGGNRLHRVLRSDRGLTYGASADANALKEAGDIVAETDTRSETTGEALRLMVDEFWRLQRDRVSERELSDAQAYLTGSFPLTIETPSAIALQVLNAVFYGLDLDELQTFRERVNAVTPDDIQRVARQYLHPDKLTIVLVGDASTFATQLPGVGFGEFERIPIADLDLTSGVRGIRSIGERLEPAAFRRRPAAFGLRPAAFQQVAPRTPAADAAVRAVIERAVQAKGGPGKLRSIRTIRAQSRIALRLEDGREATLASTSSIRYPGSFRVDAHTPGGLVTQVFSNGQFWITSGGRTTAAPPSVADDLRANVQRDSVPLLLGLLDGRIAAKALPAVTVHDRPCPALALGGRGVAPLTVVFDPDTHLILQQRYSSAGAGEGPADTVEEFSDYRDVSGLKVAYTAVVRIAGRAAVTRTVQSFQYNVPLDEALFTRPAGL